LNWADDPVGYRDKPTVDTDYGVAIEVWTGGRGEDECPLPETDDVFANPTSGKEYGYLLFGGIEWRVTSDLQVKSDVTTVTLGGITTEMTQWGRGPYNVVLKDATTAGRLLDPFSKDPHYHFERTPVAPPDATPGSEAVELAVASIFTSPNYYYGPTTADVAPAQPSTSGS
jgi:hypothetical protein